MEKWFIVAQPSALGTVQSSVPVLSQYLGERTLRVYRPLGGFLSELVSSKTSAILESDYGNCKLRKKYFKTHLL